MEYLLKTGRNKATLSVFVQTQKPQRIHIVAFDPNKMTARNNPLAIYANHGGTVNGSRRFDIPLPKSPDLLKVMVFNEKNGWRRKSDNTFKVQKFGVNKLKTWQTWASPETKEFIAFAQEFCDNAGILKSSKDGLLYESRTGRFKIKYYDRILSPDGKKVLSTPARISNKTAVIEVSKMAFGKYSIPMRMVILMHEYSHFYLNKNMRNEIQADLNGLYYYLGEGYSPIEAHKAFLTVFNKADNAQNELRYQMIKTYVEDYYSGKIAKPNGSTQELMLRKAS